MKHKLCPLCVIVVGLIIGWLVALLLKDFPTLRLAVFTGLILATSLIWLRHRDWNGA